MICPDCGYQGKPKTKTKGSILIEIVLWLFLIVPGLVYSLWRHTSGRYKACPTCGGANMIPQNSPKGRKLIEKWQSTG